MAAWSPDLKLWVQETLAKATPSNKAAVNAELKQILFKAHSDKTMDTTDWSKVELKALKPPPLPTYIPPPPPPATTSMRPNQSYTPHAAKAAPPAVGVIGANGFSLGSHSISPKVPKAKEAGEKKRKRDKTDPSTTTKAQKTTTFPTAYYFESDTASAEDKAALAKRAARFSKPAASSSGPASAYATPGMDQWFGQESEGLSRMSTTGKGKGKKGKFGIGTIGMGGDAEADANVMDWDRHTIKGTNMKLEKSYLRLTSEPSPADIRPLHVLQQTLGLLKQKYKENKNYAYSLDQFKSVRQDLTVQRIKNEFTVEVYEVHARIALEAKDLGEYNQCQSMLRQLYELGIRGHPQEFLAYRILYLLHTKNRSDMATLLAQLTPAEKADPGVHHALQTAAALATSNYVRFFRLFNDAPNMAGYIMDHFVERERMAALAVMSRSYHTLRLSYIASTLSFESASTAAEFLQDHDAAIYTNPTVDPSLLDNKDKPKVRKTAWKTLPLAPKPTPPAELIWDAKKAHAACMAGMSKYRVVDLKGQVD